MRRRRILRTYSLPYLLSPVRSIPYSWYFCCILDVNIMSDLDLESLSHTYYHHPSKTKIRIINRQIRSNLPRMPCHALGNQAQTCCSCLLFVVVCCSVSSLCLDFPFRAISRVIHHHQFSRPRPSCGPTCRLTPRSSTGYYCIIQVAKAMRQTGSFLFVIASTNGTQVLQQEYSCAVCCHVTPPWPAFLIAPTRSTPKTKRARERKKKKKDKNCFHSGIT